MIIRGLYGNVFFYDFLSATVTPAKMRVMKSSMEDYTKYRECLDVSQGELLSAYISDDVMSSYYTHQPPLSHELSVDTEVCYSPVLYQDLDEFYKDHTVAPSLPSASA